MELQRRTFWPARSRRAARRARRDPERRARAPPAQEVQPEYVAELESRLAEAEDVTRILCGHPSIGAFIEQQLVIEASQRLGAHRVRLREGPIEQLEAEIARLNDAGDRVNLNGLCAAIEPERYLEMSPETRRSAFSVLSPDRRAVITFAIIDPAPTFWHVAELKVGGEAAMIAGKRPADRAGLVISAVPEAESRAAALESWRRTGSQPTLIPSLDEPEIAAEVA